MINGKVISIDIGSKNIHIVEGKRRGKRIMMKKAAVAPTPPDSFADGKLLNPRLLKQSILSALKQNDIKTRRVILSIQSTSVITREMVLPAVKQEELATMVQLEAERFLPIVASEYVIQCKVLGEIMEEYVKKLRVNVAAMPKEIASSYFDLFREMKLKPVALDIHSNAVSRVFTDGFKINDEKFDPEKTAAVMDVGYNYSSVSIISGRQIEFSRIIMFGGKHIDMEISRCLGITLEEAEEKKLAEFSLHEISFIESSPGDQLVSLKRALNQWIVEIQKIFTYHMSRNPSAKIETIYIYGGGSGLSGLSEFLEKQLGIPAVNIIDIGSDLLEDKDNAVDEKCYINAIGGMLRC